MLRSDDDLRRVNAEYLGPAGYTLPFRARYSAYSVGIGLAVVAWVIVRRSGVPVNLFTIVWTLAAVVVLTRWIGRRVSYEMPLRAMCAEFWHEVCGPRVPKTVGASFLLDKVRRRAQIAALQPVDVAFLAAAGWTPDAGDVEALPVPLPPMVCNWCQVGVHGMCPDDCACTNRSHR